MLMDFSWLMERWGFIIVLGFCLVHFKGWSPKITQCYEGIFLLGVQYPLMMVGEFSKLWYFVGIWRDAHGILIGV